MNKFLFSFLLAGTILSSVNAFAEDWVVRAGKEEDYPADENGNNFAVTERSTLTNYGNFDSGSGNIFYMDSDEGKNLSGSQVTNYGEMLTDGSGHAIYFNPKPNERATTTVDNYGTMYRINLGETGKSAASYLGAKGSGSLVRNHEGATLSGSVILGTYATLENFGKLTSLSTDEKENRYSLNNLIYMDKEGVIKNGFRERLLQIDPDVLWVDLTPFAEISTDNIVFGQSGTLYNAGIIDNKTITAFDDEENPDQNGVKIYLMNNPFYETDEVVYKDDGSIDREKSHLKYFVEKQKEEDASKVAIVEEKPILHTEKIDLSDDATFRADQGSEIVVTDSFVVDKNAQINIGADYYWESGFYKGSKGQSLNWERDIKVEREKAEEIEYEEEGGTTTIHRKKYILGEPSIDERALNVIPLRSTAMISELNAGENARITIKNTDLTNAYEEGEEVKAGKGILVGDNATVNIEGSEVALLMDEDDEESGQMTFGKNGKLNISGYWQDEIAYSDNNTRLVPDNEDCPSGMYCVKPDEYIESVLPEEPVPSIVYVGNNLVMDEGAKVTLTGIETKNPHTRMGNRSDVVGGWTSVGSYGSETGDMYSPVPDAAIYLGKDMALGNNSTISLGGGQLRDSTSSVIYDLREEDTDIGKISGTFYVRDIGDSNILLGDHSTIQTVDQTTNMIVLNSISFGDFGTYKTSKMWDSDGDSSLDRHSMDLILKGDMSFKNDGYFFAHAGGVFSANQLNMLDRAEVHAESMILAVQTIVGSDSNIYLDKGAGITNGLFRQDGAKNITVYSTDGENFLLNGVDVDDINIQSGGLRFGPTDRTSATRDEVSGDIHGTIHMDSDTYVHFTGSEVKVYDPIERNGNAKNTLVWIDLDDGGKINTLNTIDSDVVMIGGGTLNVHHDVSASKIILDDAGALRVFNSDLVHADVTEYETAAANTTVFIKPEKNEMDSFGSMQLDRLVIENGTFNAYHPIIASAEGNNVKTAFEGIWLGTNAAINTYNDVQTSKIIRRQEEEYQLVTNTTARLMKGNLFVDQHIDVDHLILKSGTFNFRNIGNLDTEGIERDMIVTDNRVVAESGVNFLANGSDHPNSGKIIIGDGSGDLVINSGARIALSNTNLSASDAPGQMNINANLFLNQGSTLDLRTSDAGSDLLKVSGKASLADDIRLIVRNMQEGVAYNLIHADDGVNKPDNFQLSFRWHDTTFEADDRHNLNLTVGHITTLKEELEGANVGKNIQGIGGYISDNWDGAYGPWDNIFYATNLEDAVAGVREYVPDGYVAAPQVALRVGNAFQNVMAGELGDMRRLRGIGSQRTRIAPSLQDRRPVYRGRAGGDRYDRPMYQPYVRNRYQAHTPDYSSRSSLNIQRKGSYRTNKGGIWAKPFYVTSTQDTDKGISGYDYDAYGLSLGLDHRFGRWTWGLAGVYAKGDFEQEGGMIESDVDTLGVGIYGNFKSRQSGFFTDVFASYMQNKNKATHKIQAIGTNLKADYDTTSIGAGIAFGYDFALAQSLYLTPKIGFNYAHLSSDEIKEKGNAPLIMRVKNPNVNSMQLPVELRVAFPVSAKQFELLPELHVRYTHDFGDTDYQAKAYLNGAEEAVKLDNVGMPENLFTVGGGMSYISGAHELSGYYDYDFGDGLTSHIFNVGYKFLF